MSRLRNIFFIVLSCMILTGCGNGAVKTGDRLYIPEGYNEKLIEMNLVEVAAMPYFHSPFITIAKDKNEKQYAVIFYENGQIDTKKLDTTYEEILYILMQKGCLKINAPASIKNIHLFEIHGSLHWNFCDSDKNIYINTSGKEENPFK